MDTLRREDERATLRQEEAQMATLRREDERWLPFAEKMRDGLRFAKKKQRWLPFAEKMRWLRFAWKPEVVCEVYDMKFILGGVLEYRNADFRCIIFMSTM